MKIKIVMLSGGYDSTGLLFWALRNPEWAVHVHHVELRNADMRWEYESRSVAEIVSYLNAHGMVFEYSQSVIENFDPWFAEKDIVNVGFMAAQVARGVFLAHRRFVPEVEVFTGGTLEDHCSEQMERMDGIGRKTALFNLLMSNWPDRLPRPAITIPFANTPKQDVIPYIPTDLLPKLWTCRHPIQDGGECGSCKSCIRKQQVFDLNKVAA
jgi:7-cyano-7-deazaguanine synthase in queuosine biosynthesis